MVQAAQKPILCHYVCVVFLVSWFPHLLEGKYSHLCCSHKCKYYEYDVGFLRGGGIYHQSEVITYCRTTETRWVQSKLVCF